MKINTHKNKKQNKKQTTTKPKKTKTKKQQPRSNKEEKKAEETEEREKATLEIHGLNKTTTNRSDVDSVSSSSRTKGARRWATVGLFVPNTEAPTARRPWRVLSPKDMRFD